jgi:hypothetical protein
MIVYAELTVHGASGRPGKAEKMRDDRNIQESSANLHRRFPLLNPDTNGAYGTPRILKSGMGQSKLPWLPIAEFLCVTALPINANTFPRSLEIDPDIHSYPYYFSH